MPDKTSNFRATAGPQIGPMALRLAPPGVATIVPENPLRIALFGLPARAYTRPRGGPNPDPPVPILRPGVFRKSDVFGAGGLQIGAKHFSGKTSKFRTAAAAQIDPLALRLGRRGP